jgi:hypothetical protein
LIERILTGAPRLPLRVTRPFTAVAMAAWAFAMFLVLRKATEQTALALTADLSSYGERAKWSGIYYRGEKIGFSVGQTTETPDGFRIQEDSQLQLTLMGATTQSVLKTRVEVDREYALRSFDFSLDPGSGPIHVSGRLETPTRLVTRIVSAGSERERVFELREPPVLNLNLSRRLVALGLAEGKRFEIQVFDPATLTNGLSVVEVGPREVVRIQNRPVPAFKVKARFSGIDAYSWITDVGEVVKEESPIGMIVLREDRERAMAMSLPSDVRADMIEGAAIQPEARRPIDDPTTLRRIVLRFDGATPAATDEELNGGGQTYRDGVFEIVDSRELRAGPGSGLEAALAPEPFIESDAPEIRAHLAEALAAAPRGANARRKAEALVRHVNALIEKKPTMSLPSAVEVLRTRVGDCNEHTALYVGLARAAGIPSRVAIGLVNLRGAFYYHAWPEVFVEDERGSPRGGVWLPVDPTLNQFPADVTHVRLARGGFDRQAAILPLLGTARIGVLVMEEDPAASTRPLVGADSIPSAAPLAAIDLPAPAPSNDGDCWRRPSRRRF